MDKPRPTAAEVVRFLREAPYEALPRIVEEYGDDGRSTVRRAVASAVRRLEAEGRDRDRVVGLYNRAWDLAGSVTPAGIDEVGRGPLAGPLAVGAVVLPPDPMVWGIDDSKRLSPARREALDERIREVALAVEVVFVEPAAIDARGMARCLREAMAEAAAMVAPFATGRTLIDGNPVGAVENEACLVGGDGLLAPVACASIVAKVARDRLMVAYDEAYPGYGFASNKGYGSADHIRAIREHGLTPVHRASFCGHFVS